MLQGKSKIELFDAITGKKTFEHEEHNMITKAYEKAYGTIMSKIAITDDFSAMYKYYPRDFSKGILLLNSTQTADANNFVPKGNLVGYASSNGYSGSSTMRGSFNTSESVPLSNPSGYKYVWDFTTNQANGTINTLALTPNNTMSADNLNIATTSSPTILTDKTFSDEAGDNYYQYYYSAGVYGFTKYTLKSTIPYLSTTSRYSSVTYTFTDCNNGLGNIVYYGGYVYLVLKKTSDSKWYIVKSDTSGNIVSTTLINTTLSVACFGIVENYIIYNGGYSSPTVTLKVFNMSTGAYASDITFTVSNGNAPNCFYNIGTSLLVSYNNSTSNYYNVLIDENLNLMKIADDINEYGWMNGNRTGNYIGNAPIVLGSSAISIAPFTMFTINNLATAVSKTSANTMKISYSLTWS